MNDLTSKRIRFVALGILSITLLMLLVFAVGEVAGGDIFGLQHVLQAVPLVVLAWVACRNPLWGGAGLTALSIVIATLFFAFLYRGSPDGAAVALAVFFLPPFVAGVLFLVVARRTDHSRTDHNGINQSIGAPSA